MKKLGDYLARELREYDKIVLSRNYNLNYALVGRFAELPTGFTVKIKIRLITKISLKTRESLNSSIKKVVIFIYFNSLKINRQASFQCFERNEMLRKLILDFWHFYFVYY